MGANGGQIVSDSSRNQKRRCDWHKRILYILLLVSVGWHIHTLVLANDAADAAMELITKCAYW